MKKFWTKIKHEYVGKNLNQVKPAKEKASELSACYTYLRPSCLRILRDKDATEETNKNRRDLCKKNSFKSKVNETKTEEKKPCDDYLITKLQKFKVLPKQKE